MFFGLISFTCAGGRSCNTIKYLKLTMVSGELILRHEKLNKLYFMNDIL